MRKISNTALARFVLHHHNKMYRAALKTALQHAREVTATDIITLARRPAYKHLPLKTRRAIKAGTIDDRTARAAWVDAVRSYMAAMYDEQRARLVAIVNAPDVTELRVCTEWRRSPTWGYIPNTTCRTWTDSDCYDSDAERRYYYETTGSASGCGYDTYSAATAGAFNRVPALLKLALMCAYRDAAETRRTGKIVKTYGYHWSTYGLQYEGGTGYAAHERVILRAGLNKTADNATKTTNYVQYNRAE